MNVFLFILNWGGWLLFFASFGFDHFTLRAKLNRLEMDLNEMGDAQEHFEEDLDRAIARIDKVLNK